MQRRKTVRTALVLGFLVILGIVLGGCGLLTKQLSGSNPVEALSAPLPNSLVWTGHGRNALNCTKLGESPERTASGWIYWVVTNARGVTEAQLVLGGSGSGTYAPKSYGSVIHFFTPYFEVATLTATFYYAGILGNNPQFNISDYCPGVGYEKLDVSKTVVTSYTRTHNWSIDKDVNPKSFWLYINGSGNGTATWTIDVFYNGYTDSDFNVSGVITIVNTGTLDAVITNISDILAGTPVSVVCPVTLPYTLKVGQTLTCTYSHNGYVEGINQVMVVTQKDTYSDSASVFWGEPTSEVHKTVAVVDVSDLFGTKTLGEVTAPNNAQFVYTKSFAWADYGQAGCGNHTYYDTVKVIGGDSTVLGYETVKLDVYVQCYIYKYETAYAKGASAICFIPTFSQWGWTNPIKPGVYTMQLWAAAGRCDTSKGILVGSVAISYTGGYVNATYNISSPYVLKETHFYAGKTKFPVVGGRQTVAPGQYYNASPFADGTTVYVIAHAVVGIPYPDPKFGP